MHVLYFVYDIPGPGNAYSPDGMYMDNQQMHMNMRGGKENLGTPTTGITLWTVL